MQIITDSACDLPKELVEELDIDVLPFVVNLAGKEFLDGKTIEPEAVYAVIKAGQQPKTSQVPAKTLWETFTSYAEKRRECLYLAFSAKLSGTCDTARMVAEEVKKRYPEFRITICDTQSGSLGQGLIVLEAAQMLKAGASEADVLARVKGRAQNVVEHIFTVDDLHHLHRGGRLSYASAFLGGILKVKPILHVWDGKMIPLEKVRGKAKALRRIADLVQEKSLGSKEQLVAISHAHDWAAAQKLKELLSETLGYQNFLVNTVGSVLGCHIGLGGVAAFFVNKRTEIPNIGVGE